MYKNILVPIDVTEPELTDIVIPHVELLAKCSESKVHFVTVIPAYPYHAALGLAYALTDIDKNTMRQEACDQLTEIAKKFALPNKEIEIHVLTGSPRDNILKLADNIDSDLIIIASRRPSISTYLLGSTAAAIVRYAKPSVLVVR